jgi:hypothetical protein
LHEDNGKFIGCSALGAATLSITTLSIMALNRTG